MSAPDFTRIAGELADTFKRAAFDRLMHEDGCPEGEQIKAGIAAIAPAIYRAGQHDGLKEASAIAIQDRREAVLDAAIREEKEKV